MRHLRKFDNVSDMNTTLANSTIGVLGVAYEGGNVVMENKPTPPRTMRFGIHQPTGM